MSNLPGWLDRIPRPYRHLLIQLMACLLAWGASDLVPALHDQQGYAAVVGALIGQVLLVVTPLVRSYGASWDASSSTPRPSGRHVETEGDPHP